MSEFAKQLKKLNPVHEPAAWIYVPYDQLTDRLGPLSRCQPSDIGIVMVETPQKADRRPYHKQKLAMILANMRHFALEQAKRGVRVAYLVAEPDLAATLSRFIAAHGPVSVMEPAEHELRAELAEVANLKVIPHEGWLTTTDDFRKAAGKGPPWRMDAFYRQVRKRTNILMDQGKPVGGKYSFDAENRKPWKGDPPAPTLPTFEPDAVTREVGELVERQFANHPGRLDLSTLPATRDDANT
ncbi:MAG: cryptochrome/photolyase family protein, partial [bacterium]